MGEVLNAVFDSSLSSLYSKLAKKQDELRRLQEIIPELEQLYNDFAINALACLEPSLVPDAWKGDIASDFDEFRNKEVYDSYKQILDEQFPQLFLIIQSKIESLLEEIQALHKAIAAAEAAAREEKEAKALQGK